MAAVAVGEAHPIPRLKAGDPRAHLLNDAAALVAENGGQGDGGQLVAGHVVGVADAAGSHLYQDFAGLRGIQLHVHNPEVLALLFYDRSLYPHKRRSFP